MSVWKVNKNIATIRIWILGTKVKSFGVQNKLYLAIPEIGIGINTNSFTNTTKDKIDNNDQKNNWRQRRPNKLDSPAGGPLTTDSTAI
jgi:hypothetical protein